MSEGELPRFGFIHIPKNAGTSVVRAIAEHALPIAVASHHYPERLASEEIVVLRDPVERFVSAFYYGRAYWANPVNWHFRTADSLALAAADPDDPLHAMAWHELGNQPEDYLLRDGVARLPQFVGGVATRMCWVYEPQSTWLVHAPRHHLRHKRLEEDFRSLVEQFDMGPLPDLPRLNTSDNPGESLSARSRRFLETLYADDYRYLSDHGIDH